MELTEEVFNVARQLVDYSPETGIFVWLPRGDKAFDSRFAGKTAGTMTKDGYVQIVVSTGGKVHFIMGHRLAWFIEHNEVPCQIDHINHNRGDNRISNLRNTTPLGNARNKSLCSDNKSGFHGVSWHKRDKRWRATIVVNKVQIHLGNYLNKEDAVLARLRAEKFYGFHENHGLQGGEDELRKERKTDDQ